MPKTLANVSSEIVDVICILALDLKRAGSAAKCIHAQAHISEDLTQIFISSVVFFIFSQILFLLCKKKFFQKAATMHRKH